MNPKVKPLVVMVVSILLLLSMGFSPGDPGHPTPTLTPTQPTPVTNPWLSVLALVAILLATAIIWYIVKRK